MSIIYQVLTFLGAVLFLYVIYVEGWRRGFKAGEYWGVHRGQLKMLVDLERQLGPTLLRKLMEMGNESRAGEQATSDDQSPE